MFQTKTKSLVINPLHHPGTPSQFLMAKKKKKERKKKACLSTYYVTGEILGIFSYA